MTLYQSLIRVSELQAMHRDLKFALGRVKLAGFDYTMTSAISDLIEQVNFELEELGIPYDYE